MKEDIFKTQKDSIKPCEASFFSKSSSSITACGCDLAQSLLKLRNIYWDK
jgi:hypothetical protein